MGNVEYGLKMKGVPKKERQERKRRNILTSWGFPALKSPSWYSFPEE